MQPKVQHVIYIYIYIYIYISLMNWNKYHLQIINKKQISLTDH
jgi:hypothetical protein